MTAGQVVKDYNDTDHTDSKAVKKFSDRTSAAAIGQIISLFNPILGNSVGLLINDATKEDGLTNLDNGRMANAYSQGLDQGKGNYYYQAMVKRQESSKNEDKSQNYKEVTVVKWRYRNFVEIDIMVNGDTQPYRIYEPRVFNSQNTEHDLWRTLTSYSNYNASTKYGIEIIPYETVEKVKEIKP